MPIDRVGKGGAPQGTEGDKVAGSAATRPFEIERKKEAEPSAPTATEGVQAPSAATPLAKLRAGEIGLDGYLDAKVDAATRGLQGLTSAELDEIKRALRAELASDPSLVDLVRAATGQVPSDPEG